MPEFSLMKASTYILDQIMYLISVALGYKNFVFIFAGRIIMELRDLEKDEFSPLLTLKLSPWDDTF